MPSVTGVVLEGVPARQAGTASAVFNTFRQVGGAVAIAVFGALIANPDHVVAGSPAQPRHRRPPAAPGGPQQPPHPAPRRCQLNTRVRAPGDDPPGHRRTAAMTTAVVRAACRAITHLRRDVSAPGGRYAYPEPLRDSGCAGRSIGNAEDAADDLAPQLATSPPSWSATLVRCRCLDSPAAGAVRRRLPRGRRGPGRRVGSRR